MVTRRLYFKKKDIKRPFFPPCTHWPIWEGGDSGFLYTLLCDDAVIEELRQTDLIKLAVQPNSRKETNMIDTLNSTVQRAFRGSQAGGELSKLASMIKQKREDFLSPSERESMQQILKAAVDTALGENHDISDTMRDHLLMDKNILKATKACKINAERNDEAAYVPAMHNLWKVGFNVFVEQVSLAISSERLLFHQSVCKLLPAAVECQLHPQHLLRVRTAGNMNLVALSGAHYKTSVIFSRFPRPTCFPSEAENLSR